MRPTRAPQTIEEALARCPFRTVIGLPPTRPEDVVDDMVSRLAHTLAVLGGDPVPISPDTMQEFIASLQLGRTVLVMSDRRDLRDRAKAEILAMASTTGARA